MDKFGIFNILNSFFSKNNNQSQQTDSVSPEKSNGQNDFLGGLLSSLTNSNQAQQSSAKPQKPQATTKETPPLPLQAQMLSTMRSHDDFIKRVKQKQQKD